MLYLLLIVLCCLYLVWMFGIKKSKTHLEPPELSGWFPIVGHGYKIMGNGEQMLKGIMKMSEEGKEKGGSFTVYLGLRKVYGIVDPEDALTVMNTCLQKNFVLDFFKPILGDGLITADVPTWKKNRKLLNPAFNQQVLDGFIGVFNTQAEKLVDSLTQEVGKPFDQEKLLRVNNLETICSTSLGIYGSDSEYNKLFAQYLPGVTYIIKAINERIQKFWLHSDFLYNLTPGKKQTYKHIKNMTALSTLIIQKKKAERENRADNVSTTEIKSDKFKPFINLILDLAAETGCFSDEQIRAETETVIAAGHDTTSSTLTFTLAVLGSHPEIQEKAYHEILNVFGDSEKSIDREDLNKLVYIEAIIKETLRLYAVVPIIPRFLDKDVKLKNYTLKANTDCFILVPGVNCHSMWGPDASQFRPERWLDKENLPDPKYFATFGMGRRACIGKSYAMMSMKITLTHLVKKFHIQSDVSKMISKIHAFLKPQSGHYISLTLRNT